RIEAAAALLKNVMSDRQRFGELLPVLQLEVGGHLLARDGTRAAVHDQREAWRQILGERFGGPGKEREKHDGDPRGVTAHERPPELAAAMMPARDHGCKQRSRAARG